MLRELQRIHLIRTLKCTCPQKTTNKLKNCNAQCTQGITNCYQIAMGISPEWLFLCSIDSVVRLECHYNGPFCLQWLVSPDCNGTGFSLHQIIMGRSPERLIPSAMVDVTRFQWEFHQKEELSSEWL